jgi:hypothetical protein
MSAPTADEIRTFLEGYGIEATQLTSTWIENRRDRFVIPYIENITRQKYSAIQTVIEYYNGNGTSLLILNRRPVVALVEVRLVTYNYAETILGLGNIEVISAEGMLKAVGVSDNYPYTSVFPKGTKNIKVTYTYGYADYPADIKEAITYLCAEQLLGFIGARTGGGSVSGQSWSRNFGPRGKYTDIRNDLARQAMSILRKYMTSVVA